MTSTLASSLLRPAACPVCPAFLLLAVVSTHLGFHFIPASFLGDFVLAIPTPSTLDNGSAARDAHVPAARTMTHAFYHSPTLRTLQSLMRSTNWLAMTPFSAASNMTLSHPLGLRPQLKYRHVILRRCEWVGLEAPFNGLLPWLSTGGNLVNLAITLMFPGTRHFQRFRAGFSDSRVLKVPCWQSRYIVISIKRSWPGVPLGV
ncbi:hypothetical protein B0H19DRAFT_1276165 [Mycena capillaripes]|nr:hypothetical protein B0H19DRAFT_1276165 [Mycena capillaripes]